MEALEPHPKQLMEHTPADSAFMPIASASLILTPETSLPLLHPVDFLCLTHSDDDGPARTPGIIQFLGG